MKPTESVPQPWAFSLLWLLVRLALIAVVLYVAWQSLHVAGLMLVSGAFAYILCPVVDTVCRYKPTSIPPLIWRGFVTLLAVVGLVVLIILGARAFVSPFVQETKKFIDNSSKHQAKVEAFIEDISAAYDDWYKSLPEGTQEWAEKQREEMSTAVGSLFGNIGEWTKNIGRRTGAYFNFLIELLLAPVLIFYLVYDSRLLRRSLRKEIMLMVPRRHVRLATKIATETNAIMRAFIVGQLILCVIAGVAMGIGLALFGVPYALTMALFAGVARAIPVIGSALAGVPITLMALVVTDVPTAVGVAIFITVLFFIEHKMIMPKIIGDSVDLHPAMVILILLVVGKFFGLMGMFFGVPVAVIARNVALWYNKTYRPKEFVEVAP